MPDTRGVIDLVSTHIQVDALLCHPELHNTMGDWLVLQCDRQTHSLHCPRVGPILFQQSSLALLQLHNFVYEQQHAGPPCSQ